MLCPPSDPPSAVWTVGQTERVEYAHHEPGARRAVRRVHIDAVLSRGLGPRTRWAQHAALPRKVVASVVVHHLLLSASSLHGIREVHCNGTQGLSEVPDRTEVGGALRKCTCIVSGILKRRNERGLGVRRGQAGRREQQHSCTLLATTNSARSRGVKLFLWSQMFTSLPLFWIVHVAFFSEFRQKH